MLEMVYCILTFICSFNCTIMPGSLHVYQLVVEPVLHIYIYFNSVLLLCPKYLIIQISANPK